MTARSYVREARVVTHPTQLSVHVVKAYSILSTDWVAFDVHEAYDGHTSSCSFTEWDEEIRVFLNFPTRLGALLSRPLPAELAALPYGEERARRVQEWHRSLDALASDLIQQAFPDVDFGGKPTPRPLIDLDVYHASVGGAA